MTYGGDSELPVNEIAVYGLNIHSLYAPFSCPTDCIQNIAVVRTPGLELRIVPTLESQNFILYSVLLIDFIFKINVTVVYI